MLQNRINRLIIEEEKAAFKAVAKMEQGFRLDREAAQREAAKAQADQRAAEAARAATSKAGCRVSFGEWEVLTLAATA